jgi:hypothetical protein
MNVSQAGEFHLQYHQANSKKINTALPALTNPCNTSVIRKIFKRPQAIQWIETLYG